MAYVNLPALEERPPNTPAMSRPVAWDIEAPELRTLAAELLNVSGDVFGNAAGRSAGPTTVIEPTNQRPRRVGSAGRRVRTDQDVELGACLLANLLLIGSLPEFTTLGIHLNATWYATHKSRLPEFATYRRFRRVHDALVDQGVIARHATGSEQGGSTRVRPTPALWSRLQLANVTATDLSGTAEDEIELRGPARKVRRIAKQGKNKGKRITVRVPGPRLPFDETPQTAELRRDIRAFNEFLEKQTIGWADTPEAHEAWHTFTTGKGSKRRSVDITRVRLRRVFNIDWVRGGRYYGGWWQVVPGRFRQYITINGEPTVELDFEALHLRLCYALHKLPAPDLTEVGQWYEIPGIDVRWRPILKLLTNQMLNCADIERAIKATMDVRKKRSERKDPDKPSDRELWQDFVAMCIDRNGGLKRGAVTSELRRWATLIVQRHQPIERWFKTPDGGAFLQNADSWLMWVVLELAMANNIPALPIHDSVVVRASDADFMRTIMTVAFNIAAGGGGLDGQFGTCIKQKDSSARH